MTAPQFFSKSTLQEESFCKKENSFESLQSYSQLITQSPCIPYIPELGDKIGIYPALFLQQIHYWLQKGFGKKKEERFWIHNSYESWAQQLKCSLSCIRKTVNKLKQQGLIETKAFRSKYGDTTKWYAINYEALKELGFSLNEEAPSKTHQEDAGYFQELPVALNENSSCSEKNIKHAPLRTQTKSTPHVSQSNTPLSKINKIINNLSPAHAESVYQHMISIWNEVVHQGAKPVKLTERRFKRLRRRFKLEFKGCIEKWKDYCSLIASNDFLMGMGKRGWRATFDWAILPHNIQKVLRNHYQHWIRKKEEKQSCSKEENSKSPGQLLAQIQEAEQKIETSLHSEFWKGVSKKLLGTCGVDRFTSWISQLLVEEEEKGRVVIKAPSRFTKDWIENHLSEIILQCCREINPEITKLDFEYNNASIPDKDINHAKLEKEMKAEEKLIESSSHPIFWKEVCKYLLGEVGVGKYKSWLSSISFKGCYQNTVTLKAVSEKTIVWLKRNYADRILEGCQKLDPKIAYLEFVCE